MYSVIQLYENLIQAFSNDSKNTSVIDSILLEIKDVTNLSSSDASFSTVYSSSLIKKLSTLLNYGGYAKECLIQIIFGCDHFFDDVLIEQKRIAYEVISLLTKMLDPLDFERLPKIYSLIVEKLKNCVEKLLSDKACKKRHLEVLFVSLLASLKPLLAAKNSLVVMSGLSPPLFELLFEQLPISNKEFAARYPLTHLSLLKIAKYFCEVNGFFSMVSNLRKTVPSFSPSDSLFTIPEARHSKCLTVIFSTLSTLLHNGSVLSNDTVETVLLLAQAIPNSMGDVFVTILEKPQLLTFRTELFFFTFVGVKKPLPIRRLLEAVTQKYFVIGIIPQSNDTTSSMFWRKLLSFMGTVSEAEYKRIFYVLRSTALVRPLLKNCISDMSEKRQIILKESSFGHREFILLLNFMTSFEPPLTNSRNESCLKAIDFILNNIEGSKGFGNDFDGWRTAMAYLAVYCIENKMKTIYGKPLDTFIAFDNTIRSLMNASNNSQVSEGLEYLLFRDFIDSEEESFNRTKLIPSEDFLRANSFLSFVDNLEKFMSFAERGSIIDIATISESSRQFFVTNLSSCQGWITRISLPLLQVCYKAGRYAQVVRFATFICHVQQQKAEAAKKALKLDDSSYLVLYWLVKALVQLSSPQAIYGVHTFCATVFGTDLEFIWPAISTADGQFEDALNKIEMMLAFNSLHEIARNFLQELRILILTKIRMPSLFLKSLKHSPPTPESSNAATWNEWKRCANFIGEGKSIIEIEGSSESTARVHSLPWEIEHRIMDFEQKLLDIQARLDLFSQHKRSRHQRMDHSNAVENELKELGNQINQYLYTLNMVDIPSKFHNKFAVLETIRKLLSGKLLYESHKSGNFHPKKELDLIELNQSLLDKWRINTVDRLSIGEQIGSWIDKLNYYDSETLYQSHMTLSKLACKTSNLQMAKHHLHQMEEIKKAEQAMDIYSNYSQNPYGNGMMHNGGAMFSPLSGYSVPPGYAVVSPGMMPPQMSPNMSFPLPLEMVVQTAKIARLSKNNKDDGTAFFTLGNAISIQDVAMCSPTISPAPGMQRENPEFLFQIEKVRRAVLKLGNWSTEVSNGYQRICETNKYQPNPLWEMIIKRFNVLGNVCGDTSAEKTLQGSLYWLATEIGSNLTTRQVYFAKAHRKLAEWSLEQLYKDEDCILNLTGTELMSLQAFGITLDHVKIKEFQKLLTISTNFAAFKNEAISLLKTVSISAFESLSFERLWNQIKQRQATLFDISLKGYLHFLAQQSSTESKRSIHTVTATLHILKMLTSHPDLFEGTTRSRWLADTNENIWKDIIPQLFARLNHPDDKVRTAICDLLKKISVTSPHAICFPAIVGAYFSRSILVPSEAENDHPIGENEDVEMTDGFGISGNVKQDRTQMSAACLGIVEAMQQQYPQLVNDVTTFIRELQRINMLPEEKWMFVLNNLDVEMTKRIRQLEIEDQRTFGSKHLSTDEKNEISRKRSELFTGIICQILEDFFTSTFKADETDISLNEAAFREEFERDISAALKHFVENRVKDPKQAWIPFKKLASVFNHRASKKSSLSLNIHDLSPFLASMRNSAIPMPGQELQDGNIITIASMKEQVTIMVTKTRPKKITFIGSDGKEYVFLFKGQEDLHLDERVMQLLHICNLMLSDKKHISAEDAWPPYICKNYSVTPIGIRSGLIRWVSGATSMFQIYRKFKSRQKNNDPKNVKNEKQENSERPMDIFFKHLKSAFQANNIPLEVQQDRKQWPVSILRQVLEQLIAATPRDILSRELWMAAGNSETWWKVTQRFARSTAVASMVGAVIGLGDRHMENLLINLSTGDVIHIDYNICFDKGRHLRVPETVPFRLTGNIVNALGPTQIEGTFRQSCEHVIGVLRKGKETLLSMLDAFVFDPLVDWAMQDQAASATVNVSTILAVYGNGECNISNNQFNLSLFKLRIQEFQVLWLNSAKLLEDSIQKLLFILQQLKKPTNVIERAELNEKLRELTTALHNAIRKHYNIASYFRPLIKSLASSDDSFCIYAQQYAENLSDSLARGFKLLNEADFNIDNCYDSLKSVAEHVYEVHNGLIKLASINQLKLTGNNLFNKFEDLQMSEENSIPRHLREDENAHAKMISKRIRRRLDGCEHLQTIISDSSSSALMETNTSKSSSTTMTAATATTAVRRQGIDSLPIFSLEGPEMTTTEQVNMLIDSATNLDNLCLLYEGWTAWV